MLYGGNNNWFASYAYWYFTLYGHEAVKLLDGGRKKWELDSRELVDTVTERPATTYTAKEQDTSIRAFRDDVLASIGTEGLVDVRSPDEYAGRLLAPAHLPQEQSQRGGHIPTAKNIPWSQAANDDGTFKSDEDLKALYEGKGVDLSQDTIAYCRIGERSAHTWFALHEILGIPNVRNYDGSWTEYGSLVGVPVQLGDEPGSPEGGAPDVRRDRGRPVRGGHRRDQGGRDPGHRRRAATSRSAAPTCGCSTRPVSSPPRSRRRPPGSSGSSPRRAPGRCARWRPAPRSTARSSPSRAPSPRSRSPSPPDLHARHAVLTSEIPRVSAPFRA